MMDKCLCLKLLNAGVQFPISILSISFISTKKKKSLQILSIVKAFEIIPLLYSDSLQNHDWTFI